MYKKVKVRLIKRDHGRETGETWKYQGGHEGNEKPEEGEDRHD